MAQKKDMKSKKWYCYGKYTDEYGNVKQFKKRGYNTKAEAKEAERTFKLLQQNIDKIKKQTTFKELTELYQNDNNQNKISSRKNDFDVMNKINGEIGNEIVTKITSSRLQKYIDKLDNQYSKRYVEKLYYTINKVFEYGVLNDHLIKNPLKKVRFSQRRDEVKKEMSFWEPEQFNRFISIVDNELYYTIFNFLYFMGCRKGEALALSWSDIDLNESTVRINKTVNFKLNGMPWQITTPKTNNSFRTITMPKKLCDIMKQWKDAQSNIYGFKDECYVFGFDRPLAPENLRRHFKNYIIKANQDDKGKELPKDKQIPVLRIHDLRHSHASYLINNMSNNFTDFDIAKRLGDTVQTLHDTYAHWFKAADKGIIEFMDEDI